MTYAVLDVKNNFFNCPGSLIPKIAFSDGSNDPLMMKTCLIWFEKVLFLTSHTAEVPKDKDISGDI